MAYQGGYGGDGGQRPYAGPAARRPAPPGGYHEAHPQHQVGGRQPVNDFQNGQAYDGQRGGYRDEGAHQYQDSYAPGPGRGRPMPPYAREGGPIPRPGTADGVRGGPHPRGRGMGRGPSRGMPPRGGPPGWRPGQYPPGDYSDAGYGSYDQEHQLTDQMSAMDLNRQRSRADGRSSHETAPSQDQGYGGPQQGLLAGQIGGNFGRYDDAYSGALQRPPENEFGPPTRSMTMPVRDFDSSQNMLAPRRVGTVPLNGHAAAAAMPPRPATAGGHRPPPQRIYPADLHTSAPDPYAGGAYGNGRGGYGSVTASPGQAPLTDPSPTVNDVYDAYYDGHQAGGHDTGNQYGAQPARPGYPNFESAPADQGRGSFDQSTHPALEQTQPGAHGMPRLHHAQSEANFHEPQAAVFEMAGDIPSVPPMPQVKPYRPEFGQGYSAPPAGHDQLPPRGPSAPPGPIQDARAGGIAAGAAIHGTTSSSHANADTLPSHPTPVRPGLMANSMVNMNNRPPPVRNYGQQQQQQQQPPPQQYNQYQPPQQQQQQSAYGGGGYSAPLETGPFEEPVTPHELERLRMVIKVNANDQESALRLAKRLIQAADILAPKLPDPKQRMKARERYLMDSHKVLKKLSNAQNSEAMFVLADSLGKGLFGNEPDNKEAFTLYQSAAKVGHAAAAYRTAVCCEIGHEDGGGTRKDPLKAMQWYKRAATLGDPPAMYKVGMILLKGLLGQPRNPREAVGWLKRAAERADAENPHALHELGLLYESAQPNDAIVRDEGYALDLFKQAADLGYKFSQYRLGCAFEHGALGCPIDSRQSIYWYSQAAQQEEHQSELALSGWYLTGSPGVLNQSDTEAYLWARKAAVAGLAKAEYAMGYFTEVGIGVPANMEDAKRWYWRAAAQDFPKARDRLEDLKRVGKGAPFKPRERLSRSRIEKERQDGECTVM
ncbi:chitin synthase activator (Chs3) [Metarhizium album ARSEF 1941]|uniref:Chitin synthase activator (Chs3) n=1 Tax=Metarhizium album (strain ARSEF 1941) TaxID=1081103 RepID=A0A0B2WRV9_METAS|nr:chitin synthase activator (Chs3) [Metarhizium album ARSEF 1941]KHN98786.1 chitin synthase activator (Chs3) [Metarhizium album ARSEF 1941]